MSSFIRVAQRKAEDCVLYICIQLYMFSLACIYKQCNIDNCFILTVYMYNEISLWVFDRNAIDAFIYVYGICEIVIVTGC